MNTVQSLLNVFEGFRMEPTPNDQYEATGKPLLAEKLESFVNRKEPIDFVMLGFPFKSTNRRDKVLGILPDKGEEVTLNNFAQFNKQIKEVHKPGAIITIVSDGLVFNDILHVEDKTVHEYKERSIDMAKHAPVVFYDLADFYSGRDIASKRVKVMAQFGITPEKLEQEILFNPDVNHLYRGMTIFMMEELADKEYPSKNQLQKAAKILTRQMMFRNEAYSNLVRAEFSKHIRLSMHPSVNNGAKYSFKLIPGKNTRHSAWHSAILMDGEEYITIHKKEAEEAGYDLAYQDGQPFYYVNNNKVF
jgi:pyoverdine/dityrosine biosynthesis protein Dit1